MAKFKWRTEWVEEKWMFWVPWTFILLINGFGVFVEDIVPSRLVYLIGLIATIIIAIHQIKK